MASGKKCYPRCLEKKLGIYHHLKKIIAWINEDNDEESLDDFRLDPEKIEAY